MMYLGHANTFSIGLGDPCHAWTRRLTGLTGSATVKAFGNTSVEFRCISFTVPIANEIRSRRMQSILLCSIDSFLASAGIGLLGCSETSRLRLIIAFVACDMSATLAGASFHSGLAQIDRGGFTSLLAPVLLAVVAAAVLAYSRKFHAVFLWVPVLLSLDNFLTGLLDGSAHVVQSPLIAGLASGLLAWSGFGVARLAGPLFSRRTGVVASVSMMILAFVLVN
jgi:hypothetical protein